MPRKLKLIIIVLLAATVLAAALHLNNQKDISCMLIKYADEEISVDFEDLNKQEFSGELKDGKGDISKHVYSGVLLKDLLTAKGVDLLTLSGVKVTSADNYSADFSREDVLADDRLYAATIVDGKTIEGIDDDTAGVQIIIFGDANSRRCVRFASIITVF